MVVRAPESKILDQSLLSEKAAEFKRGAKSIISTNGCFDVLHWGHITYLNQSKALGSVLVVGVNSDESVRKLKGPARPIHSERIRALQVAALECVDWVCIFSEDTPEVFLEKLRPTIHVKGGDYDPSKLPERRVVEHYGGRVQILPFVPGFSTTGILSKT